MSLGHYQQCWSKSGRKGTYPLCLDSFCTSEGMLWLGCVAMIFLVLGGTSTMFLPLSLVTKTKWKRNFSLARECSWFHIERAHWRGLSRIGLFLSNLPNFNKYFRDALSAKGRVIRLLNCFSINSHKESNAKPEIRRPLFQAARLF